MKRFRLLIFFFVLLFMIPYGVRARENVVNIYFFHSNECPHCKEELKFLDSVSARYSFVKIYKYEVHDEDNNNKYKEVASLYKMKGDTVPFTVIGDKVFTGFSDYKSKVVFMKTIIYYSRHSYVDRVSFVVGNGETSIDTVNDDDISVDEFIKSYGNYKIIGFINSDDVIVDFSAMMFSFFTEVNAINILFIVGILFLISRVKSIRERTIYIGLYVCSYLISNAIFLVNMDSLRIVFVVFFGVIFGVFGIRYLILRFCKMTWDRKNELKWLLFVLGGGINNFIKFRYFSGYLDDMMEVIYMNMLSLIDTVYIYAINSFVVFLSFLVIFGILLFFRSILLKGVMRREAKLVD